MTYRDSKGRFARKPVEWPAGNARWFGATDPYSPTREEFDAASNLYHAVNRQREIDAAVREAMTFFKGRIIATFKGDWVSQAFAEKVIELWREAHR